jgi:hypothetical protein
MGITSLRSSTEQARPRLPAHYQHCHRAVGDGSRLPRRAACSRLRTHNTRLEKRTMTAGDTSSHSPRSINPSSILCRSRGECILYARRKENNFLWLTDRSSGSLAIFAAIRASIAVPAIGIRRRDTNTPTVRAVKRPQRGSHAYVAASVVVVVVKCVHCRD